MRALTPYSCSSRCATTSNCSWPTAPSSSTEPGTGRKTWIAPSSPSCVRPARSCLVRSGSATSTERNSSGAKNGRPVNCSASPSVSVSPSCSTPWFGMPMMSPAKASSSSSRRCDRKRHDRVRAQLLARAHDLQPHAALEVARGDAHEGDAVAVRRIHVGLDLEDDAAELRLVGLRPCAASRRDRPAAAPGRRARPALRCTPKLLIAEPKNIGVCRPARKASRRTAAPRRSAARSRPCACSYSAPKRSA